MSRRKPAPKRKILPDPKFGNLKLAKFNIHYGWVALTIAFLATVFSSAVGSVPQVLILPMTKELGWTISDMSIATGLMYFILASLCPFGAAMMLRFGLIKVILISLLLNGAGLIITVFAYEEWHLLISVGVCLGIASGDLFAAADVDRVSGAVFDRIAVCSAQQLLFILFAHAFLPF